MNLKSTAEEKETQQGRIVVTRKLYKSRIEGVLLPVDFHWLQFFRHFGPADMRFAL